jgi:hypothetical protein
MQLYESATNLFNGAAAAAPANKRNKMMITALSTHALGAKATE